MTDQNTDALTLAAAREDALLQKGIGDYLKSRVVQLSARVAELEEQIAQRDES